jgi:hypothetical protein
MLAALGRPFLTPIKELIHQRFEPCRIEEPLFQMLDHGLIEPVHRIVMPGHPVLPCRALVEQV